MQKTIEQLHEQQAMKYNQQAKLTKELIELDIQIAKRIKYEQRAQLLIRTATRIAAGRA